MMKRTLSILLVVAIVALAVFGAIGIVRHSPKSDEAVVAKTTTEYDPAAENLTAEADTVNDVSDEEESQREIFDFDAGSAILAYSDEVVVDQETFDKLVENLNKNWDVGVETKDDFVESHPEIFASYVRDKNGKIMVPWSNAQMINQDHARQYAAKELGLEKDPINDALDFPNAKLTELDVKAILAASNGQKVELENEIEEYRTALFQDWLSKPVVFDADIRLLLEQKIGSEYTLRDNWNGPTKFVDIYDLACGEEKDIAGLTKTEESEILGTGVNHWLRCFEDKDGNRYYYLTEEYVYDYVIPFISWAIEQPFSCEVLTTTEHYHLIAGDNDILRRAELANYKDAKAAFVFRFMLKNNTVGLIFGVNARDGRPEILNYTTSSRESRESRHQQSRTTGNNATTQTTTTTTQTTTHTDNTQTVVETKSPADDIANAITDHQDDDAGPGPYTEDIGDSKSATVEGSQAHADTVVNVDGGNPALYPTGPAADNTDNGTPPDTSAPENQIGTGAGVDVTAGTDEATSQPASTTTNVVDGRLNMTPQVVD